MTETKVPEVIDAGKKKRRGTPRPNAGRPQTLLFKVMDHPLTAKWLREQLMKKVPEVEICIELGINRSTYYRWKKKRPELWDNVPDQFEAANEKVKAALYEKATGYKRYRKIYNTDGECTGYEEIHHPPDVAAQKYWLNNREPENWKDKIESHVTSEPPPTMLTYSVAPKKIDSIEVKQIDFYESEH